MPRPTLHHEADGNLGWHRPVLEGPARPWMDRPVLRLNAGVHLNIARVQVRIALPSLGEFPHELVLIDARWKPETVTPWDLMTAASMGMQRWVEGYTQ